MFDIMNHRRSAHAEIWIRKYQMTERDMWYESDLLTKVQDQLALFVCHTYTIDGLEKRGE
jgi:hypothetical protein